MKAKDLDYDTDCDVCDGDGKEPDVGNGNAWGGECPACGGDGVINRYDRDNDEVVLKDEYEAVETGDAFITRRVHYPRAQFETLFGDSTEWTPPVKENLDNPDSEIGEDDIDEERDMFLKRAENRTSQAKKGPNPSNEDLTPDEAVEFAKGLNDDVARRALENVRDEIKRRGN